MRTLNNSIASASPSWPSREKALMLRVEPYLAAVKNVTVSEGGVIRSEGQCGDDFDFEDRTEYRPLVACHRA